MKRIFTILILVCFVAVMAVPAFAADVNTVSGVWIFNETISRYSDTSNLMASPLNFSSNGETFNTIQFTSQGVLAYQFIEGVINDITSVYSGSEWVDVAFRTVNFGSTPQTVSVAFYNWFVENASIAYCDSASCPSLDINNDDICDVCGGFFTDPLLAVVEPMQGDLTAVLTPILTILPIGLGCLVGYKGLRKALALLRRILLGA